MFNWNPVYERNLLRLYKAHKYLTLALASGTLRDTPLTFDAACLAQAARKLVQDAIDITEAYKKEHK